MPCVVRWYVKGRVSVARSWSEFTLDEMRTANRTFLTHIRSGQPPVHLLMDMREISKLPGSFVPMLKEIEIFRYEPNLGTTLILTSGALMPYFATLSSRLTQMPFVAAVDYFDANAKLIEADPSLDGLLPEDWRYGMMDSP